MSTDGAKVLAPRKRLRMPCSNTVTCVRQVCLKRSFIVSKRLIPYSCGKTTAKEGYLGMKSCPQASVVRKDVDSFSLSL